MHLLNTSTKKLTEFVDNTPPYAILSHTWDLAEEEVGFEDLEALHQGSPDCGSTHPVALRSGYKKIQRCCEQARCDGLDWVWVDTCCIDKNSSTVLSEAINSMFSWYKAASVCYVFLADVTDAAEDSSFLGSAFRKSRWFTRGWTLQELLAPRIVRFFSSCWAVIGEMGEESPLSATVASITGIPVAYLLGFSFRAASIAQRMSWASNRATTRREYVAYCLLGIFDVNMPLLYGEGEKKAFIRLQEEILKQTEDHSILAWGSLPHHMDYSPYEDDYYGILATSPASFANCANIVPSRVRIGSRRTTFEMTNLGLRIELPIWDHYGLGKVLGVLDCNESNNLSRVIALQLRIVSRPPRSLRSGGRTVLERRSKSLTLLKRNGLDLAGVYPWWKILCRYSPKPVYLSKRDSLVDPPVRTLSTPTLAINIPSGYSYRILYMEPTLQTTQDLCSNEPTTLIVLDPSPLPPPKAGSFCSHAQRVSMIFLEINGSAGPSRAGQPTAGPILAYIQLEAHITPRTEVSCYFASLPKGKQLSLPLQNLDRIAHLLRRQRSILELCNNHDVTAHTVYWPTDSAPQETIVTIDIDSSYERLVRFDGNGVF